MKLITFQHGSGDQRVGALTGSEEVAVDLAKGAELKEDGVPAVFQTMISLMEAGPKALDDAARIVEWAEREAPELLYNLSEISLLSPVPRPTQIRDFLCFEKHLRQAREVRYRRMAADAKDPERAMDDYRAAGHLDPPPIWYEQPIFYNSNRMCVIGTGTDVIWPEFAEKMDYELEFGVFIGKSGSDISKADAGSHIFGYSVFNDISARDTQIYEMTGQLGPGKGKDFDTANVIGPCIVTADEIDDPYDLIMTAKINGEEMSRGNSGEMHHNFEDIIAYLTRATTVHCGEFLGSGTVGSGCGLEYDRYLNDGDLMELTVEGIGTLRNKIIRAN